MNDKQIENRVERVLKKYDIYPQIYEKSGAKFLYVSDDKAKEIPFEDLSEKYRICKKRGKTQFSNKIDLNEMIHTMKEKKQLRPTTKPNMHKLVEFYDAVNMIKIKDNFEIVDRKGLFRYQDKITYRIISTLENIFPDIKTIIKTQYSVFSPRGELIFDICIPISEINIVVIEIEENHHSKKNIEIADKHKRSLLSRAIEIRTFVQGRDDTREGFEQFIRSLCYDIINYNDTEHLQQKKLRHIANFISYNIKTIDNEDINPAMIEKFINVMNMQYIDIDQLVELLYAGDPDSTKSIIKSMDDMIKKKLINKRKIKYADNKKDVVALHKTEFMKFMMMHQDVTSNRYRIMFSRINSEYIAVLKGDYHKYRYKCSHDELLDAYDNELFVFGNLQSRSRSGQGRKVQIKSSALKGNVSNEEYENVRYFYDSKDDVVDDFEENIDDNVEEDEDSDHADDNLPDSNILPNNSDTNKDVIQKKGAKKMSVDRTTAYLASISKSFSDKPISQKKTTVVKKNTKTPPKNQISTKKGICKKDVPSDEESELSEEEADEI